MFSRLLIVLLPLALVAGGWLFRSHIKNADIPVSDVAVQNTVDGSVKKQHSNTAQKNNVPTITTTSEAEFTTDNKRVDAPATDLTNIGLDPLSDRDYEALQAKLHTDSALVVSLLEEYRNNTNPKRARQLAALLGEHNRSEVTNVAADLVYSGDPVSQEMGLDLLSRLQPVNTQARDIAIELLTSVTDPQTLVSTMNVLATPARTATDSQRERLFENTTLLATHHNANVRSHSIALLGRWNKTDAVQTITNALTDNHPQVRARAVSALRGLANPENQVVSALLTIAENRAEEKTTRQSALYAMKDMGLQAQDLQRYRLAQRDVRTRQTSN